MSEVEIKLSDRPDGYGFYYGTARKADTVVRVYVLPPEYLWAGDVMLGYAKPDPVRWTVYADGEIIARIARQEDVGAALVP